MASGTLGTLEISVLANIANMVSDLGKAQAEATKASKEIQRSFQEAADAVGDSFRDLAATIGLGFGIDKLAEFTKSVVEAGLQIYDVSLKTGISAQTLSSYSVAAAEAGISVDTFANTLSKMARSANDAAHGEEAQANAFKELGVSVTDSAGHLKSADDLLRDVAVGLDKLQDGLGKTAIVTEIFGRGGAALIPLLSDLGEGVDAARQKAIAFGLAINDAQAKDLKAFDVTVTDIGLAIRGDFTQALIEVLPQLQRAATEVFNFISHSQGLKDAVNDGAQAIIFLAEHIDAVTTAIKDLAEIMAARYLLTWAQDAILFGNNLLKADAAAVTLKTSVGAIVGSIAAWDIGTAIGNWLNGFSEVKAAAAALVGAVIVGWDYIKEAGQVTLAALESAWDSVIAGVRSGIASLASELASVLSSIPGEGAAAAQMQAYASSLESANTQIKTFAERKAEIVAASDKEIVSDKQVVQAMIDYDESTKKAGVVLKDFGVTTIDAKIATDGFAKTVKNAADVGGAALDSLQAMVDKLTGAAGGPAQKAWDDYTAAIIKLNQAAEDAVIKGADVDQVIALQNTGLAALAQSYDNTMQKIYAASDALGQIDEKFQEQLGSIKGIGEAQQVEKQYLIDLKIAQDDWNKSVGEGIPMSEEYKQQIHDIATAQVDQINQTKQSIEVMKDWQNIVSGGLTSAMGDFNKALVEGGSLMDALKSTAQQVVEAILAEFEKLAIINPLLNSIFGLSGSSALPTLFSGNGGGIGSLLSGGGAGNGIFGGGGLSGAFTGNGVFGTLFGDSAGAASAAQSTGIFADLGDSGAGALGAAQSTGILAGDVGEVGAGVTDWGAIAEGGQPVYEDWGSTLGDSAGASFLGKALPILGGVMAGIGEFKAAGGGIGGLAGGAAYGVGTAGLAIGASAALSGGIAAGLAAIPVVGWIGLAAMAVNIISGGKLFGTAGKLDSSQSTLDVGATGATVDESYTLKGQKAFFGGTKYTTKDVAADPAAVAAANAFFDSIQKNTDQFAQQFNVTVGTIVGGSFQQTFDKNGKATGTTSTVLGQTYSGETQEQFGQRLIDENDLSILDTFDSKLSGMLDTFRATSDMLTQVTTGLTSAEMMFQSGGKFLALGTDQSLSAVLKLAEGMQASGETIDQTFARIEQAQQQYDSFVAQFAPAETYVDPFEESLSQLNAQFGAAVDQANALAQAAGATGASITDLTNIQQSYANQAAALTQQLEISAQSLAFSLGVSTTGTLDEVNQEIQALTGSSASAAPAIRSAGDAMKQASQKATDAMNLLLGSLSPLNDQQKLQTALQGLRAGSVTQDQVLTIGRQLYASSEAYNQLFAEVQGIGDHTKTGTTRGGSGGAQSVTLSSADQARLAQLQKEQSVLQAAQTAGQFQTLAQQIAEIATVKGEDFTQVLTDMGIKQSDLEKGLGLQSDADLAKYISTLQSQTDSQHQDSASLEASINALPTAIGAAVATAVAKLIGGPGVSGPGVTDTFTPQDMASAIATGVQRGLYGSSAGSRNMRPTVTP
jgi:hypothetical protein